jgi:hypothetical protein
MKVTVFASIMLIITTAFVFINSAVVTKMADELTDELSSIPESSEYAEEYRAAEELFCSMRRYLNLTVCHDSLLTVESSFAELIGAAEAQDEESLVITKSRLIGEISHLRRLSGINMNSIF